jgi:predicted aspartyl protease
MIYQPKINLIIVMRVVPYIICFILILTTESLVAQFPYGFELNDGRKRVELSFKNESNLMIIPIKINGKGPYNFILDTGSESGMIFDKMIIGEHNLVNARTIPVFAPNGNKITDIWVASNIDVDISGVTGADQSMFVLQENFVDVDNVLGIAAHGILGSELFNRFIVEVDYTNMKIWLSKPEEFRVPKGFKKFDIQIHNSRPFMNVQIKQRKGKTIDVKLLIDTGASSALFLDADSNEDVILPERTLDHVVGRSIGGILSGKVGRVDKVKFGKFKFKDVITSYPIEWRVSERSQVDANGDHRYGTIGADLFSRFHVIFDYSRNSVYLKKNKDYRTPFRFNTIGMNVMAYGDNLNAYYINDIIEDSPAKKIGLIVGDEVIALNGSPAFFYDLTEINAILKSKRGEHLNLIIRRGGKLLQYHIKHKRLL